MIKRRAAAYLRHDNSRIPRAPAPGDIRDGTVTLSHMILAGDIGGTNTRLATFDEKLNKVREKTFENAGRASFTDVVREFLGSSGEKIERAAFGVAGPVKDGAAKMTNLPW